MNYRTLSSQIINALKTFPAIIVTGPRQSGKTTLLKHLLSKSHNYINLESPDVRRRAQDDPILFLKQLQRPVIIDEIQYAPLLLSYIKNEIDENRKPGNWVLTGSQNFALMEKASQSLAGRVAILSLLPFSFAERNDLGQKIVKPQVVAGKLLNDEQNFFNLNKPIKNWQTAILRGNYPEIATKNSIDQNLWCGSYISTYLERDVRNLSQVGDLNQFDRFLKLCATRTGQILNMSDMARDIGISVPTAKRWLSLLEASYQIFLLFPYYKNINKRLVKSPKLYFNDTGLATYLLGLDNTKAMLNSPHFGALFETYIVTDFWKRFLNSGQKPSMYYLKTRDNLEVDLILEIQEKLHLLEIKSSSTLNQKHAGSLIKAQNDLKKIVASANIISLSEENYFVNKKIKNIFWQDLLLS